MLGTSTGIYSPIGLDFPEQFTEFRPAQEEAIEFAATSERRIVAIGAPPGVGKSGIAYALARLLGGRTVILTANLGLMHQYEKVFASRLALMRGRANYQCGSGGTCEDGRLEGCTMKAICPYSKAFEVADKAELVLTNYAYWLASHMHGTSIANPDTLILDEAHLASDWLSNSLDYSFSESELQDLGIKGISFKHIGESREEWQELAPALSAYAEVELETVKKKLERSVVTRQDLLTRVRWLDGVKDRADRLTYLNDNWVITREEGTDVGRRWLIECVWPGMYREKLFQDIPRIILMSATMRPKTLSLLGLKAGLGREYEFREWSRQFPSRNGPVFWIPTARMSSKTTEEDELKWLQRIDEIITWGKDRNGIIHTVSYARAKRISEYLGNKHRIIVNGAADPNTATARQAYERFVGSSEPNVLISPSFGTGWDFDGRKAEWQIIAKIPIPDTRSKVMTRRVEADRGYSSYHAAQELVQACGRINRSADDLGQTFIIDDSWAWFKSLAQEYLPNWFRVTKYDTLPKPLPKI